MDVGTISSLNLARRILDSLGILDAHNPMIYFPDNYVAKLRGKNYREQWEIYIKNYWYNFMLSDGSLLIYEEHSFRFLMSPLQQPTREEFLHEQFGDIWDEVFSDVEKKSIFVII